MPLPWLPYINTCMTCFKHIMLDFDGVIADTETLFADYDCLYLNRALERAGQKPDLVPEYVRTLAGIPPDGKLVLIAEDRGFDPAPYIDGFMEERSVNRSSFFVEGKVKLGKNLMVFAEKHSSICSIVTNKKPEVLSRDLGNLKIENLFPRIISREPGMKSKPAPDLLLKAMEISRASPEESVYVGDNELDMQAAIAAAVYPVGFVIEGMGNNKGRAGGLTNAGARIVIDDFMELSQYLEKL